MRLLPLAMICTWLPFTVNATVCQDVTVQVLGSGGPELNDARASSSYLIWHRGQSRVLLDTGSGSSVMFDRASGQVESLNAILFSHFHTDHSADFASYIKGAFFTEREQPLVIGGPAGNRLMPSTTEFVERQIGQSGAFAYLDDNLDAALQQYPIRLYDQPLARKSAVLTVDSDLSIQSLPVKHGPVAAVAWKVNIGGCTITYSGDMNGTNKAFASFSHGADIVIIHAAINEGASPIAKRLHMAPSDIVSLAESVDAKTIVLSHFMNRSQPHRVSLKRQLEQVTTSHIVLAEDLMTISAKRDMP